MNKILQGHCLTTLRTLPDQSVHCCVTSPPYFGLRDYGHSDQIGQESTPDDFVASLVEVFREVRRVLRDDGTLWVNIGDSYAGSWGNYGGQNRGKGGGQRDITVGSSAMSGAYVGKEGLRPPTSNKIADVKEKDLIGIPWLLAFALRKDGWYLRQDIIWHKPNPMPESVQDRCTKSHEYIFLLSKSPRYFFDHEAIKEPAAQPDRVRADRIGGEKYVEGVKHSDGSVFTGSQTRNKRSVWTVTTKPYREAHFATYPVDLITPCILAGTSEGGCCPTCLTPWQRTEQPNDWQQACPCAVHAPRPCIVLDPFMGAGTTAVAAVMRQRQYIGCELNPEYIAIAEKRIQGECGLFLLGDLG